MADNTDFSRASRRILFGKQQKDKHEQIPGAGRSAAEAPHRHVRVKVTMNLDGDILNHFKEAAKKQGRSYQLLINQALREFVEGSRPEQLAQNVGELLLSSPSFLEALAGKLQESKDDN